MKQFNENWDGVSRKNANISEATPKAVKAANAMVAYEAAYDAAVAAHNARTIAIAAMTAAAAGNTAVYEAASAAANAAYAVYQAAEAELYKAAVKKSAAINKEFK